MGVLTRTMRTLSCTLVAFFLFSLPLKLNGNLSPVAYIERNNEHITENQQFTHITEGSSGLLYSTDAGKENVVSLSTSTQMLTGTSDSEQRDIRVMTSSADILNQRGKRDADEKEHNLTSTTQKKQEEVTTQATELLKTSKQDLRPEDILNSTQLTSSGYTSKNPLLPDTKTTGGFSENQTLGMPSTSTSTGTPVTFSDVNSNTTITISVLHPIQLTLDNTVQPDAMTDTHPSTAISMTSVNLKTTHKEEITDERTDGPETQPTFTITPKQIFTTRKSTTKTVVPSPNNNQKSSPGTAVAAVIGTTFVFMFIAIVIILLRKRKIQKMQQENPEWAGPSPFLDGDVQPNLPSMLENETVNRRGFSQMSISRYLPQRLSKHLTLRRDTNEEVFMGDILQGSSTFGRQNPEDIQAPNGEPTVFQDSPKTEENENHQGAASVDTKIPEVTVDMKESGNDLNDDVSKPPSQDTVMKPLTPLVSIDLDSLPGETVPSQTSDVGNVPPAPPLP